MVWIRNWYQFHEPELIGNRIIVHGHTPIAKTVILEMMDHLERDRVLNIDNGGFRKDPEMGELCGVDLMSRKVYFSSEGSF